jgi:hypothetical protein
LTLGSRRAESDTLTLPANRQAELSLTFSDRSLIAVLSITPAVALVVRPTPTPVARAAIEATVAAAARREHAVLLQLPRQVQLLNDHRSIVRCLEQHDCQGPFPQGGEVAYVLLLTESATALRAELLDLRTADVGAELETNCAGCRLHEQAALVTSLTQRVLKAISTRSRGQLDVSSTPTGAQVVLDSRVLGLTPLSREVFSGTRQLSVLRRNFVPHEQPLEVTPTEPVVLKLSLQKAERVARPASPSAPRPRWRLGLGGALVGAGLFVGGFGVGGLVVNGQCRDGLPTPMPCQQYDTGAIGGSLLGVGLGLSLSGAVLMALPGRAMPPSAQP